ncbi:MAG: thiamine ABC transporter substrate-binding protein [Actinomycetaceae bacterium]|nr:thiamine ABC transporter substrate-binding protein [Actinomycetaceae bacterium]
MIFRVISPVHHSGAASEHTHDVQCARHTSGQRIRRAVAALSVAALGTLGLAACSDSGGQAQSGAESKEVTLVTHNNFNLPKESIAAFEKESGLKLHLVQSDSGAELVNKLKLRKDNPIGDAVYGLATNDMGAVAKEGLLAPLDISLPEGAKTSAHPDEPNAVPIDRGDICVNIDTEYFQKKGLAEPKTLDDLTKPEYKGLFVTINASDVTGFGFFAATVARYGADGWQDYWKKLKANDVRIVPGWTEAYQEDFTQGGNDGKYPIVLSYEGSPAYTVDEAVTKTTTKALPDTCYQNVEYAGVLTNAKNPKNAQKVIEWLLSQSVQSQIPDNMYMYPVDSSVELPKAYQLAPQSKEASILKGSDVVENQEKWVKEWTELVAK